MKKLAILAVLACMVFGFAATASAVDLDAKGKFQFQMNIIDNSEFLSAKDGGQAEDDMRFYFRARAQFRFIANENLWGVLYTEYRTIYGTNGVNNGGINDGDDDLRVKNAYLQYRFPGTEILTTAGRINVNLPGAASDNMILGDADLDVFMLETPITDQIAIAGAFIRIQDLATNDSTTWAGDGVENDDELDAFYAALPITIDGISATPYFLYANIGKNTNALEGLQGPAPVAYNKNLGAWWLGTSFEMDMFDPIVFAADLAYGSVDADKKQNDRDGFFMDASLAYTGLDFVKPKLVFAYSTGEDDDSDNGSERMPIIDNNFAFGTSYFGGGAFTGNVDLDSQQQIGMWVLGLQLEDISFIEKLSHDINFLFIKGTNDADLIKNGRATAASGISADGTFLTDEDTAYEVDFTTRYQIYDELSAVVELAYVAVDFDDDTWKTSGLPGGVARGNGDEDPMLKCVVGLMYSF
ncbi:outer membrane homotrimeric porin [Maridesulfovibrio sp.]|uniref:outer membrane homotrimeric porin n=1 Tax=Maridesulfovibrio sp. TaxID=2795000 RepID=UPI0029F58670|nr:outer membrane homotrimeric porin [Maridesulfovibrio sp.]